MEVMPLEKGEYNKKRAVVIRPKRTTAIISNDFMCKCYHDILIFATLIFREDYSNTVRQSGIAAIIAETPPGK